MSNITERLLAHGGRLHTPQRIVVHCMAEQVIHESRQYPAWELLNLLKLSAHVLIYPNGNRVRCRQDAYIAYHARGFNTNTLGVEVLVPAVFNLDQLQERTKTAWASKEQMDALVEQVLTWKKTWPIEGIDRHSDLDPTRRWFDPGRGFPWVELLQRTWR